MQMNFKCSLTLTALLLSSFSLLAQIEDKRGVVAKKTQN